MADALGNSIVEGVVIPLTVEDKASPKIKELASHFQEVAKKMSEAGKSQDEILKFIRQLIIDIQQANPQIVGLGKTLTQAFDLFSEKWGSKGGLFRDIFKFDKVEPIRDLHGFLEAAASSFVAFKVAMRPGRDLYRFAEQCTKINFQLSTMAMNAGLSVQKLTAFGGAFGAFGGSARDFADLSQSYALEMERRRRGMGTGGRYAEAWRRYGIQYDSREEPEQYFRRVMLRMQAPGTTDAERLNIKSILGLSDAMFRAMKKGPEAYDREVAFSKRYADVNAKAVNVSEELTVSMSHVNQAFQNFKNHILIHLEKPFKKLSAGLVGILDFISKAPPLLHYVGQVLMSVIGLLTMLAGAKKGIAIFLEMAKYFLGFGVKKTVGQEIAKSVGDAVTKALGKNAPTSGGKGITGGITDTSGAMSDSLSSTAKFTRIGAIGSVGSAVTGAVSAGANLVSMFTGLDTGINTQNSVSELNALNVKVKNIHDLFLVFVARMTGDRELVNMGIKGQASLTYDDITRALKVPEVPRAANMAPQGNVSYGDITIKIDAPTGNPTDIAEKVKDVLVAEFRVLAMRDSSEVLI